MFDSLAMANTLLAILIALLTGIGRLFYKKLEKLGEKFEDYSSRMVSQNKDIEYLRKDVNEHETRITTLETHHARKN